MFRRDAWIASGDESSKTMHGQRSDLRSRRTVLARALVCLSGPSLLTGCGGGAVTDSVVESLTPDTSGNVVQQPAESNLGAVSTANASSGATGSGATAGVATASPVAMGAPPPYTPMTLVRGPIPSWVPAPGQVAVLKPSNGLLTNTFASIVAPNYEPFYSAKLISDFSGSVVNPYWGSHGAIVFEGGGHSATNDNSVIVLELGPSALTFKRMTHPLDLKAVHGIANDQGNVTPVTSADWGEYRTTDGSIQPASRHSYGEMNVIGPDLGGAAHGSFVRTNQRLVGVHSVPVNNYAAHKVDFHSTEAGTATWQRLGTLGTAPRNDNPLFHSELVPLQWRIYKESCALQMPPRWFDLSAGVYVQGTGTPLSRIQTGNDGGRLIHIPERGLMLYFAPSNGVLTLRHMDVTKNDPSWVNTLRTLSHELQVTNGWSAACWCADNSRLILGQVQNDLGAVFEIEIPDRLDDPWPVVRAPLPAGQSIAWFNSHTYKKWSYNPMVRGIVFMPKPGVGSVEDTVYVYRPRST